MRLDLVRGCRARAFDHVGINRALRQEARVAHAAGFFLKDADELLADDAPLLFRVGDTGQRAEEAGGGVHADQFHPQRLVERRRHLLAFIAPQQASVHEDARQLVADGTMHQRRHHGAIHAAAEAADHLPVADLPGCAPPSR
jgi:hypothetical protein